MFNVSSTQMDALARESRKAFLEQVVVDWFAAFEVCHGKPPRIGVDDSRSMAAYIARRMEAPDAAQIGDDTTGELIHRILSAGEHGATSQQLQAGLEAFVGALPADEAGFALLDWLTAPDGN